MVSKSMLNSLFQKQLQYQPETQPYFAFHHGRWTSLTSLEAPILSSTAPPATCIHSLRVITWNIDFMASQPRARMESALSHLEQLVCAIPSSCAVIIHLQEMMESNGSGEHNANDLSQISKAPWVRKGFHLTNLDSLSSDAAYGQVTLVDRRLAISRVSRLHFVSEYMRDALFVDVWLGRQEPSLLRLCNVHLDSSYGSMRPVQWKALQQHLQDDERGIRASILAGDCNANQPRDKTAPQDHGFKDAYLELGRVEGDESGATWGFQSVEAKRWGKQRLDKEVFWGAVHVDTLERIGIGVQVEDKRARAKLEEDEGAAFVTDHYGLIGGFTVEDGLRIAMDAPGHG